MKSMKPFQYGWNINCERGGEGNEKRQDQKCRQESGLRELWIEMEFYFRDDEPISRQRTLNSYFRVVSMVNMRKTIRKGERLKYIFAQVG